MLVSDYYGDETCWNQFDRDVNNRTFDCIETLGEAVTAANTGGTTMVAQGVDYTSTDPSGIPAALAAVQWADVVVLALGLNTRYIACLPPPTHTPTHPTHPPTHARLPAHGHLLARAPRWGAPLAPTARVVDASRAPCAPARSACVLRLFRAGAGAD
jgi:hypothetical protein